FVDELRVRAAHLNGTSLRVLELGSGPGFLALRILDALPSTDYTMLDFSQAMHELARERLGHRMHNVRPILADFKSADWSMGLGAFDAVVTNQAVHELRHKKHALALASDRPIAVAPARMLFGLRSRAGTGRDDQRCPLHDA